MTANSDDSSSLGLARWYDLFSRGARDWLRHDEKVREAVRENLPQIIANADAINDAARTVRVPVRMLEHYHFRLRKSEESQGTGIIAVRRHDRSRPLPRRYSCASRVVT